MKRTVFMLAMAGASLVTVAACSEQSETNNLVGDNGLAIDSNVLANVAGDIAPLNGSTEAPAANETGAAGSSAAEQPRPAAPVRTPPAPAAQPEPAPKARPDQPARTERTAPRPAPKQEPSPPPASTCTPEHEAMGHCKQ